MTDALPTGKELWAEARDLKQLGAVTAQWLEGSITFHPGCVGEAPDPETVEFNLVPVLAEANRAGFVTTCSQPGYRNGSDTTASDYEAQRAYVEGHLSGESWATLSYISQSIPLVVMTLPPGRRGGFLQIPVTRWGEQERTWLGTFGVEDGPDYWWEPHVHPTALQALNEAWQVQIFDPMWGRNDALWDFLKIFTSVIAGG